MTASSARRGFPGRRAIAGRLLAVATLLVTLLGAGAPGALPEALKVIGQVLFGSPENPKTAATVDILTVYASNPTYMRMRAEGLSQTDGARGSRLFAEAQGSTNKALAKAATAAKVDVVTVPGGVTGGDAPIPDLTAQVIELLPVYHVEGKVLTGSVQGARLLAELASAELLAAIPAWQECLTLTDDQPNYHFLRKKAQDAYEKALLRVAREGSYDGIVERGGVTSRLGPVADVTRLAISVLEP